MMCAAVAALALAVPAPVKGDIFVSPSGNDSWSGRLSSPKGKDGPFATLERARNEVRKMRMLRIARREPIRVLIRKGTYILDRPIELTKEDSGTQLSPTIWAAFPGEQPLISGGKVLKGWKAQPDGTWTLSVPEAQGGKWRPMSLYFGEQRLNRSRLPKKGWFHIADVLPPTGTKAAKGDDRFKFKPGDLNPNWTNVNDIEVCTIMIWGMARMRIQSINGDEVAFTGPTNFPDHWATYAKGGRFLVENVRQALSEPGEWHLDSSTGVFTLVPPKGAKLASFTVWAPKLEQIVKVEGASHIGFEGLEFRHAITTLPPEGRNWPQAESDLPAAIQVRDSAFIAIRNCKVADVDGYAVELGSRAKDCSVLNSQIVRFGAGGIRIGDMAFHPDDADSAQRNTVTGCTVAHGGRLHPAGVGVFVGQSGYNRVERNEIADLYYSGVSVGWSWGYNKTNSHHNLVRYNHIHHLGQGVLSDMGGVYHLDDAPGTQVDYNLIHDVKSASYGGWGLYTDEGSTGVQMVGNVVYRTKSAGFHQHYGKENRIADNVFAFGQEAQVMRTRPEPHISFTFQHNIVYWDQAPLLGSNWADNQYKMKDNIYWRVGGQPFDFAGMSFADWQAKGQDAGSHILDPGFRDPANGDFRLKPDSAARKLGYGEFEKAITPWLGKKPVPLAPPAFPLEP